MSETTKHTSAPWTYEITKRPNGEFIGLPSIYSPNRHKHVATLIKLEEVEANAQLIAAAPELLEACQAALDGLYSYRDIDGNCSAMSEREKLQNAISKATQSTTGAHT